MTYAIIAAGEGSRLMQEGIQVPKPLVRLAGETLIDRLIRVFVQNGATAIYVITRRPLEIHGCGSVPVVQLQKETPSSMHSLFELREYLRNEPFILTTVDTVFREEEFAEYAQRFATAESDGVMGVTDYVDDEKPLYVSVDADCNIRGFLDEKTDCSYISAGIYGLKPNAIDTLERCISEGQHRMRNFQRGLLVDGLHLKAFAFSKVIDIDHASDIAKAEELIRIYTRGSDPLV